MFIISQTKSCPQSHTFGEHFLGCCSTFKSAFQKFFLKNESDISYSFAGANLFSCSNQIWNLKNVPQHKNERKHKRKKPFCLQASLSIGCGICGCCITAWAHWVFTMWKFILILHTFAVSKKRTFCIVQNEEEKQVSPTTNI